MIRDILTRRGFFSRVFSLVAAAGLSACGRGQRALDADVLEAVLDTLIPADEAPGAVQAGVPGRILDRIATDSVSANRYRRLLSWIDKTSRSEYRKGFEALPMQQRERLLHELYDSSGSELAQLRIDLHVILKQCFHEFYSSSAAAQVIGYHPPIEGGYPEYARPPAPMT